MGLGPMIVAGKLTSFWVYLLGPLTGGLAVALLYDGFVGDAEAPAAPAEEGGMAAGSEAGGGVAQ